MPTTPEIKDDLHTAVGPDATSTFETGGNYAGSNPTENAGSESLFSGAGRNSARSTDDDLDEDDDDVEDDDDDVDEDDEDEEDDLEDDDEEDEDDEDEDDDLEDDDEEDEDDEDDEDDDDEDDELSAESSDTIRGRNTANARTAIKR